MKKAFNFGPLSLKRRII